MDKRVKRPPKVKVAAVQAASVLCDAPVWFDVAATLEKGIALFEEAAANGANLVVFPETWLPGFPYVSYDLADVGPFRDIWAEYLLNSVEVPGPEIDALCWAARRAGAMLVMGINERDRIYPGRMHNSVVYIDENGQLLGVHRKICPTLNERLFHTPGDGGKNLDTVFQTSSGKVGGSICGEHAQLLQIYRWSMLGVQIHCSLWPGWRELTNTVDMLTRHACYSMHAFGVSASAYFPEESRPRNFLANSMFNTPGRFRGGSAIVSPMGINVVGPVYDQETIVYGDIDLIECERSRHAVSLSGIYNRWDILNVNIRAEEYAPFVHRKTGVTECKTREQLGEGSDLGRENRGIFGSVSLEQDD
ncbi:MAG: hypothetical protein KJZ98_13680 [Burkholderiaceae bacterium]|nr:hypothetical protein [Burkholderiaceae bacterium]